MVMQKAYLEDHNAWHAIKERSVMTAGMIKESNKVSTELQFQN
jgi:hypothetical protein